GTGRADRQGARRECRRQALERHGTPVRRAGRGTDLPELLLLAARLRLRADRIPEHSLRRHHGRLPGRQGAAHPDIRHLTNTAAPVRGRFPVGAMRDLEIAALPSQQAGSQVSKPAGYPPGAPLAWAPGYWSDPWAAPPGWFRAGSC